MANEKTIKPLSAEEKKEAILRQVNQERKTIIQGAIFALCRSPFVTSRRAKAIVDAAVAIGDRYVERMYIAEPDNE